MKNYIRINTGFSKIDYIICITCFVFIALIAIFTTTKILMYYSLHWYPLINILFYFIFFIGYAHFFYTSIKYFHENCKTKFIDINYDEIIFYNKEEKIVIAQDHIQKFLLIHNGLLDIQIKILTNTETFIFNFPNTYYFPSAVAEKLLNNASHINNFEYMVNSKLCNPKINKICIHFVTYLIIFCSIGASILFFIHYPSEKYKNLIVTKDFETSSKIAEYLISNDYNVSISNDNLYTLQVKNTAKKDSYTALLLLWENNKLNSDTHLVKGFNIKSLIKRNINGIIDANYKLLNKNEADNKEVLIDLVVEQNADIEKIKTQITNLLQASIENLQAENIKFSIEKR